FSTSRLPIDAGLGDLPIMSDGLAAVLPEDAEVRAAQFVEHRESSYVLWSPNMAQIPFYPGRNPLQMDALWPDQPADPKLRRLDGSFGRFDLVRFPQSWRWGICWAPAIVKVDSDVDARYDAASLLDVWEDGGSEGEGRVRSEVADLMRQRVSRADFDWAAMKMRLLNFESCDLARELALSFPRTVTRDEVFELRTTRNFERAVDLWATITRCLRSAAAAMIMGEEIMAYARDGMPDMITCPAVARRNECLGLWANDAPAKWLRFYVYAGYPLFIAHALDATAMIPIDNKTTTKQSWKEGVDDQALALQQWNDRAGREGWQVASDAMPVISGRVMARLTLPAAVERLPSADPRSYGYVLGGEEARERLRPPRRRAVQQQPAAAGVTETTAPLAPRLRARGDTPPPDYITVPPGELVTIEGYEDIVFPAPRRDSSAYDFFNDQVEIAEDRELWDRPPVVAELPRRRPGRRRPEVFVPESVRINGRPRTIFRHVGQKAPSKAKFSLVAHDRVLRRTIYLPATFTMPPGSVDPHRWGFRAPRALFFGMAGNDGQTRPTRPSQWLYMAEGSGPSRLAPPGSRAPRPRPDQLPLRGAQRDRAVHVDDPVDFAMDSDEDDNEFDGEEGAPLQDYRAASPPPLPRYEDRLRDEVVMHDEAEPEGGASMEVDSSWPQGPITAGEAIPAYGEQPLAAGERAGPHLLEGVSLSSSAGAQARSSALPFAWSASSVSSWAPSPPASVVTTSSSATRSSAPRPIPREPRAMRQMATAGGAGEASQQQGATATAQGSSSDVGGGAAAQEASSGPSGEQQQQESAPPGEQEMQQTTGPSRSRSGYIVVRGIFRWVSAEDLEHALRLALLGAGDPCPRLLRAFGRPARRQTAREREEGRSPPSHLFLQFASELDASRVRAYMGDEWPVEIRDGENAEEDVYYARSIRTTDRRTFEAVVRNPRSWAYPWQGLFLMGGDSFASAATLSGAAASTAMVPATSMGPPAPPSVASSSTTSPSAAAAPASASSVASAAPVLASASASMAPPPTLPAAPAAPATLPPSSALPFGFPGLFAPSAAHSAPQFVVLPAEMLAALYGSHFGALHAGGLMPQLPLPSTAAMGQPPPHVLPYQTQASPSQPSSQPRSEGIGRGRSLAARLSSPPAASSSRSLLQRIDVAQEHHGGQRRPRKGKQYHPYGPPDPAPGPRQGRRSPPPPP
ncbi:hypothetical protein GGG16DRAFT_26244, partial [Schizophyllum commune]